MIQNSDTAASAAPVPEQIQQLDEQLAALEGLALQLQDQPLALLDLLRRLERLHRSIQDGPFRNSLPEGRNQLFQLLSEMEQSGGWPYIPRLQLRTFMDLLQREGPAPENAGADPEDCDTPLAA